MDLDYRLPESVIAVEGTIARVTDTKLGTDAPDFGEATAEVLLAMRGDEGAGQKQLSLKGGSGDDDFTVELSRPRWPGSPPS